MWLYFYNKSLLVQTNANFVLHGTQSQFPAESVYRLYNFLFMFFFFIFLLVIVSYIPSFLPLCCRVWTRNVEILTWSTYTSSNSVIKGSRIMLIKLQTVNLTNIKPNISSKFQCQRRSCFSPSRSVLKKCSICIQLYYLWYILSCLKIMQGWSE